MRAGLAPLLLVTVASAAVAEPVEPERDPPPPPARGTQLLGYDRARWRWQTLRVPRIAMQIGAMAVSGIDVARNRAPAPAEVLGPTTPEPSKWPYEVDGRTPTIGKPADGERIAAAFGVAKFVLGPNDQGIEMLELRVRFRDGLVAWINGVEVARRSLPRGSTTAIAKRPHGPEWETFYIPAAPGLLRLGENTLALEVHPTGQRLAPTAVADLIGRRDRGIVRGPVLADATQTTATIVVETDPNVDAAIEWGTGDASDRKQASPPGRRHAFTLTGLSPNTRYGYRVLSGGTRTPRYAFHTQPRPGAVIRIGVYGDVRGGHAMHRKIVDQMLGEGLDLVAVTGDMVLRGADEADWQRFFAIATDLLAQVPYYPAVGNHDVGWGGTDAANGELFALPPPPPRRPVNAFWYSRDFADIHLVFLDSNNYDRPEQETWLEADLAAARKRKVRAIVALAHDGPYARGYHGGNAIARARYVPILARHHVDLLLSGHDHIYQRGEIRGVRYVVSGGGGAELYGIRCGTASRPKCKVDDGMITVAREHHYVVLVVGAKDLELCTRKDDGTLLEKCVRYPLRR